LGADQTFSYPNVGDTGILDWHGWDLDTAVSRVEWGSASGSAPALDSIRVNLVPETTTLVLAGLGLSFIAMRRKH
jgi:hypothetical protein